MAVFSFTALAMGLFGVLSISESTSPLRVILSFLWFGGVCLAVFVIAVNRPKLLVPPSMRGLPGALAEERLQRESAES